MLPGVALFIVAEPYRAPVVRNVGRGDLQRRASLHKSLFGTKTTTETCSIDERGRVAPPPCSVCHQSSGQIRVMMTAAAQEEEGELASMEQVSVVVLVPKRDL